MHVFTKDTLIYTLVETSDRKVQGLVLNRKGEDDNY
jgi:hypothetical protein